MIPFIDLSAQRARIQTQIQTRIDTVLNHGKFVMGPEVEELEQKLAEWVGVKHCIGVASGTDALQLAITALGLTPGDEVVVPDFSFFATSEVLSMFGIKPVFVDIDPETYNLDPVAFEKAITSSTKAVMVVDLYGQCADYDKIESIAKANGIYVIEDGAQGFGASRNGRKACSFGSIATTSFFPSKPLGCYGDGGACFTDDDNLAQILTELRNHGQQGRYNHVRVGVNSRLDTLQAAILLEKLAIFSSELEMRDLVAARYTEKFVGELHTPIIQTGNVSAWAQYTIEVDNRDDICSKLTEAGVPTAVHYPVTLSRQPVYQGKYLPDSCPNASTAAARVMSIPMHPYLDESTQDQIVDAVLEATNCSGKKP